MATHDFESAESIVDVAVCLRDGRLLPVPGGREPSPRAVSAGPRGVSGMRNVLRAAWLIARKDFRVESRSRELLYTALFFAVSCILIFSFAFVREGEADRQLGGGHSLGGDRLLGHAGARPDVRAGAAGRNAPRAAAGAGRAVGRVSRQVSRRAVAAGRHRGRARAARGVPVRRAARARAGPASRRSWCPGPSGLSPSARCSRRCSAAPSHATCCCRSCSTRSRSRRSSAACRARPRSSRAEPNLVLAQTWLSMLVFFDAVFITLSLWTFAPVMGE